jgi:hypothetical protein
MLQAGGVMKKSEDKKRGLTDAVATDKAVSSSAGQEKRHADTTSD